MLCSKIRIEGTGICAVRRASVGAVKVRCIEHGQALLRMISVITSPTANRSDPSRPNQYAGKGRNEGISSSKRGYIQRIALSQIRSRKPGGNAFKYGEQRRRKNLATVVLFGSKKNTKGARSTCIFLNSKKLLIWEISSDISYPEEGQLQELKAQRLRNQRRRKMLMASVKQKRVADFKEMVQRKEDQRKAEDAQTRDYNFHKTMRMMKLLEKWGMDSAARKKVHEEQCDAQDKENRNPLAEEKLEIVKKVKKQIAEEQRIEDHKQTQEIVTMMRQSGTIAGVNPLPADAHEDQMETAKETILRNLSEAARLKLRGQAFSYFTVDLRHFRNCEKIKGEVRISHVS